MDAELTKQKQEVTDGLRDNMTEIIKARIVSQLNQLVEQQNRILEELAGIIRKT